MPLADLPVGMRAQVVVLLGGFGMQRHLISLGIVPGKIVRKITSQPMGGPIMVEIGGVRIALGRGIARRVIVRGML